MINDTLTQHTLQRKRKRAIYVIHTYIRTIWGYEKHLSELPQAFGGNGDLSVGSRIVVVRHHGALDGHEHAFKGF